MLIEKYHGLGNDFIFLSHSSLKQFKTLSELKIFVVKICNRHDSFGADGVVFFRISKSKKIEILIVNSDGSLAATCGNALRCLGLKLFRKGVWDGKKILHIFRLGISSKYKNELQQDEYFAIETQKPFATLLKLSGIDKHQKIKSSFHKMIKTCNVDIAFAHAKNIYDWNDYKNLSISLGSADIYICPECRCDSARSEARGAPRARRACKATSNETYAQNDNCNLRKCKCQQSLTHSVFVQLENPHLVFISEAFQYFTNQECIEFGKKIQEQCNANISMLVPNTHSLRVYERGAGLTKACGSGAAASALALKFIGIKQNPVIFQMPGGAITITHQKKHIVLSAQAEFIC